MSRLLVEVAGLRLDPPLMNASGVYAVTPPLMLELGRSRFVGAVVTKSFTVEERPGYSPPVIVELPYGLLNAIGLANPGINGMDELRNVAKVLNKPLIVSIAGSTPEEFLKLAEKAEDCGASAVELNLSCPHVKGKGLTLLNDPKIVRDIISSVKSIVRIPVIAKIGFVTNIEQLLNQLSEADAVTAINTVPAMAIDVRLKRPVLTNKFGGLSGPAIHPIATAVIYKLYEELSIDIIGCGGVETWQDAIEMFLAGASAVQIGTAIARRGTKVFEEVYVGMLRYLEEEGYRSLKEIIGLAHK